MGDPKIHMDEWGEMVLAFPDLATEQVAKPEVGPDSLMGPCFGLTLGQASTRPTVKQN